MNWDAIGAIGELVGATAVFISLIYLATQIRNSKRSDQIIAASQAAIAVDSWLGQLVRDPELYRLYRRGFRDYESLDPEEKGRFSMLILQFLRSSEIVWLNRNLDTIDSGYWASFQSNIALIIGSVGGTRSFQRNREFLTPEFVSVVDDILSQAENERD